MSDENVPKKCPRCDSPQPHLHPAVQCEGEVQPCGHPWHDSTERGRAAILASHPIARPLAQDTTETELIAAGHTIYCASLDGLDCSCSLKNASVAEADFDPEKVRNYTWTNIRWGSPHTHYVLGRAFDALLVLYRARGVRNTALESEKADLARTVNAVAGGSAQGLILHAKLNNAYHEGQRTGANALAYEGELRAASDAAATSLQKQLGEAIQFLKTCNVVDFPAWKRQVNEWIELAEAEPSDMVEELQP